MKPQFVDKLASAVKDNTTVQNVLDRKDQTDTQGDFNLRYLGHILLLKIYLFDITTSFGLNYEHEDHLCQA